MKKYDMELRERLLFPEIMQLDIPDSEKVRLDKVVQDMGRKYVGQDNLSEIPTARSICDFKVLAGIGLVEKRYSFACPSCGKICMTITEEDLKKYQRNWNLLEMKPLSDPQIAEFVSLCEQGFRYLALFCLNENCKRKIDTIILNMTEFDEYVSCMKVVYGLKASHFH